MLGLDISMEVLVKKKESFHRNCEWSFVIKYFIIVSVAPMVNSIHAIVTYTDKIESKFLYSTTRYFENFEFFVDWIFFEEIVSPE